MREPTSEDIEKGFESLVIALRDDKNDDVGEAIRHAAEMVAESDSDVDEDLLVDEMSDARFDRYARVDTPSLHWDAGMMGGASFLGALVVTDQSVWITHTDTALETEHYIAEYESVAVTQRRCPAVESEKAGEVTDDPATCRCRDPSPAAPCTATTRRVAVPVVWGYAGV